MESRLAIFGWSLLGWVLITWTLSFEQIAFGIAFSAIVAVLVAPLGPLAGPWRLLEPRRLIRLVALGGYCLARTVAANVGLARRIWSPSLPIRPGMLVIPTEVTSDGALAALGITSSLIVDNQLVDLDQASRRLQYHAVEVTTTDPEEARAKITQRIEDLLAPLEQGHR